MRMVPDDPPEGKAKMFKVRDRKHVKSAQKKEILGVPEPARVYLFDIVKDNFKFAHRNTFVHRIFYCGQHDFTELQIINVFSKNVQRVNEGYCDEHLTGFLLIYAAYFVHMVEADEDTIHRHLKWLLETELFNEHVTKVKLLVHINHINQRFFEEWLYVIAVPSALLEVIDPNSDLEVSSRHILNCIKKMYNLITRYKQELEMPDGSEDDSSQSTVAVINTIDPRVSSFGVKKHDPYSTHLPECLFLEFLINTPYTIPLKEYVDVYGFIPQRYVYKDRVWPVPSDFIPYYIFDKPFDPIMDLPKDVQPVDDLRQAVSTEELV